MQSVPQALLDNFHGREGSFIYSLHERSEFSEPAFWDYYNSLIELTRLTKDHGALDRDLAEMVCHTYDYILKSFMWNFHPTDLYTISHLPIEDLSLYIERLEYAYKGFIKGYLFKEEMFELKSPQDGNQPAD